MSKKICVFNTLIMRGGGTGPMKPGNQQIMPRCQFLQNLFLRDEGNAIKPPLFSGGFFIPVFNR